MFDSPRLTSIESSSIKAAQISEWFLLVSGGRMLLLIACGPNYIQLFGSEWFEPLYYKGSGYFLKILRTIVE
jgi:hypothetical protein